MTNTVSQKEPAWHDESILEIYDLDTDTRTVVKEFPYLIEAPNWSPDSRHFAFVSYKLVQD